jgi:hypothetical protein
MTILSCFLNCEGQYLKWTYFTVKTGLVIVPEHVYDGLTCPKYALWYSNPGSWLTKEQKSRLRFEGRRLLLLHDDADEGLETHKYSLYPKEHPANCPLRWRLSNGLGVYLSRLQAGFSHHTSNLTGDQYNRDVLQPVAVPHFDNV